MIALSEPVTRAALLAAYRPIRASIQTVLTAACTQCRKADFDRATKHLGLVDEAQFADDDTFAMLCDIALFEPNQRGRRVFDGFLARGAEALAARDRDVAQRLGGAFFSLFRVAEWHEAGGVWVEDLLAGDRRLWLMDEGLEATASEGMTIGLRVFDVGPFHAGLGLIVDPDPEMAAFCIQAAARGNRFPVRHSLAAAFYGDEIRDATMPVMVDSVMEALEAMGEPERATVLEGLEAISEPDSRAQAEILEALSFLAKPGARPAPAPAPRRKRRR